MLTAAQGSLLNKAADEPKADVKAVLDRKPKTKEDEDKLREEIDKLEEQEFKITERFHRDVSKLHKPIHLQCGDVGAEAEQA